MGRDEDLVAFELSLAFTEDPRKFLTLSLSQTSFDFQSWETPNVEVTNWAAIPL